MINNVDQIVLVIYIVIMKTMYFILMDFASRDIDSIMGIVIQCTRVYKVAHHLQIHTLVIVAQKELQESLVIKIQMTIVVLHGIGIVPCQDTCQQNDFTIINDTWQWIKFLNGLLYSQVLYYKYTTCTLCDPGYYYQIESKKCVSIKIPNCLLLDIQEINCVACGFNYALQSNGTCNYRQCNSKCFTCLDNNPNFCIKQMSEITLLLATESKIQQLRMVLLFNFLFQIINLSIFLSKQLRNIKNIISANANHTRVFQKEFAYLVKMISVIIVNMMVFMNVQIISTYLYSISCKPGLNRLVINNQCICQPGMYDPENDDQICISCDITCQTCFGPSMLEQESISNRIQIGNVCRCKTGYSEYEIKEQTCGKCHEKCLTCFQAADGSENQYCLTCIPGQNRVVSDTFQCVCEVNYSDFGGTLEVCAVCHYTCGNCYGVEATNCSQCSESSYRELTPLAECLCKQSYFDDNTDNIECQKCHYTCLTCANSTEKDACLDCPSSRTAQSSGSFFECFCTDSNTFDDGFLQQCQKCDLSCKTCYGPLQSNCLTCDTNYRLMELSYCVCPIQYYDIGQLQCAECHYSCHRCFDNNAESCIMCSFDLNLRILKGNTCKCLDGYYEEVGIAQCQKCSYKCETCDIQPDKCLSCPLNSMRILDPIKGCNCPQEYFEKENEITCLKCHFKCKTCKGIEQNDCLSCNSIQHRELNNSSCQCQPNYFEMEVQECASNHQIQKIACSAFCYN